MKKYQLHLETLTVFLLAGAVRLTSLNVFRAIDEEDRWAWAVEFYKALLAGDLSATLVGDGYPGIFPVWLETLWLILASLYRSALQGSWLNDDGIYLLIHEWQRPAYLGMQRFPVALMNTILVVIIFLYVRHLFGRWTGLLAAILISLDPFYLSDSRVNRAEGLLTGLMAVSLLGLVTALKPIQYINNAHSSFNWRHLLGSALFGGLAWLTKSQSIVLIPMFTVITLIWYLRAETSWPLALRRWFTTMLIWGVGAALIFIILWPAVWTVPGPTFTRMFNYATRKVGAEGVKLFFLGGTILDEDPGFLFYPIIFLLRSTPVMLLGLALSIWLFIRQKFSLNLQSKTQNPKPMLRKAEVSKIYYWLDNNGIWVLLAYAVLYIGGMSLGSHKQDRFLMAAFPIFNILAAMGFVGFFRWFDPFPKRMWVGTAAILIAQLITALPFHPYYFSYFNPLVGGGATAQHLIRIGWGEGMDQVADYLQTLDNPENLDVASRFIHYMPKFEGNILPLGQNGEWVQADKIVFYIQQSQRMLDPSPGVIRYFQQHVVPEKEIVINDITYAQVYPNPIHFPTNPQVDIVDNTLRLLGYRWQTDDKQLSTIHLIWENLGDQSPSVAVRLWRNKAQHSDWLICTVASGFTEAAQTSGEVVESECLISDLNLLPDLYTLQVGVQTNQKPVLSTVAKQPGVEVSKTQNPKSTWQTLDFAAGWSTIEVTQNGTLHKVSPEIAFAQQATEALPASATRLEHTYYDHIRLLAYEVEPGLAQSGQAITVNLYWQAQHFIDREADASLQLFTTNHQQVANVNGTPLGGFNTRPTSTWQPGEVIHDVWTLDIPLDTPTPIQLRLDVGLFLPDTLTPLPVRNLAGEDIPAAVGTLRLEPETWPSYQGQHPSNTIFADTIQLIGYDMNNNEITLYWQTLAQPNTDYTAFVHALNRKGTLVAQSDIPAGGLFPTSAWQPGNVVLSRHTLTNEVVLDGLQLFVGLYGPDGVRLPVTNKEPGQDTVLIQ